MAESPDAPFFICLGCDNSFTRRACPWTVEVEGRFRFHSVECMQRWLTEGPARDDLAICGFTVAVAIDF